MYSSPTVFQYNNPTTVGPPIGSNLIRFANPIYGMASAWPAVLTVEILNSTISPPRLSKPTESVCQIPNSGILNRIEMQLTFVECVQNQRPGPTCKDRLGYSLPRTMVALRYCWRDCYIAVVAATRTGRTIPTTTSV